MSVTSRDVRVYCGTSSYQAGYLWAIVAALLFMVIAPVYYTIYYTSPLYATAAHSQKLLLSVLPVYRRCRYCWCTSTATR